MPSAATGWLVTGMLCVFICSFSAGPGVCVRLALTELMPTRIRSTGMGVAMVLNAGVQFLIQLVFLPVVGHYGFSVMFFFWAACTVVYFTMLSSIITDIFTFLAAAVKIAFASATDPLHNKTKTVFSNALG